MKINRNPVVIPAILAALLLGGCAAPTQKPVLTPGAKSEPTATVAGSSVTPPQNGGRYYKDDGPGVNPPEGLDQVPDAQPKAEPLHRYANNAYRIMGVTYTPDTSGKPFKESGHASWYGRRFHEKPTASGEPYNMYAMTAAHRTLPIPSYARVTHLGNGRSVVVRINDRGPFHSDRIVDLSYTAAYKLDLLKGPGEVSVELIPGRAEPSPLSEPIRVYKAEPPEPIQATALAAPATEPVAASKVEKPVEKLAEKPVDGGFWLQLGAFGRKESAEALAGRVAGLGAELAGVVQREANGLVKVLSGPYPGVAEAERAAARLQSELGIKAYKVSLPGEAVSPVAAAAPTAAPASAAVAPGASTPSALAAVGNASQHGVYLQVAAVSKAEAAEAMLARLQGQNLPGLHRFTTGALTRVQVGPYSSAEQAESAAVALEKLLGFKPFKVVK